jgi:hypothetical protein
VGAVTLAAGEEYGLSIFVSGRYAYVSTYTSPARVVVVDIRGIETTSIMAHSLEAGGLQVRENAFIHNRLFVTGGIGVGTGGIYSAGPLTVTGGSTGTGLSSLDIRNSAGTSLLYVRDDGNVGIGTTSPIVKLDVAGDATISGTLAVGVKREDEVGNCNASSEGKIYYDKGRRIYKACTYNNANSSYAWRPIGLTDQHRRDISTDSVVNNQLVRKGWTYGTGSNAPTLTLNDISYGITFENLPIVVATRAGTKSGGSAPTNLTQCNSYHYYIDKGVQVRDITASNFDIAVGSGTGNYNTNDYVCFTWIAIGTYSAGYGADIAEYYLTFDKNIDAADIVAVDPNNDIAVVKADKKSNKIVGVVSTHAGIILGNADGTTEGVKTSITGNEIKKGAKTVPLALAGRVPVKVSLENGVIKRGDPLTLSPTMPGVAVKAKRNSDIIIGRALENFDGKITIVDNLDKNTLENEKKLNYLSFNQLNKGIGKIMVFIQYSNRNPVNSPQFADNNSYKITSSNKPSINFFQIDKLINSLRKTNHRVIDSSGEIIELIEIYSQLISARINAGLIEAENMIVNHILTARTIVAESLNVTTNNLTIAGKTITQYIDDRINQLLTTNYALRTNDHIVSPVIETEEIQLKTQNAKLKTTTENAKLEITDKDNTPVAQFNTDEKTTTLFGSLEVKNDQNKGKLAEVIIKGLNNAVVARIDSQGNASFSGTLTAQEVQSEKVKVQSLEGKEATLSGKLIAKEVEAENIKTLEEQLSSLSNQTNLTNETYTQQINQIQQLLAQLKDAPLPDTANTTNLSNTTDLENLTVTDNTNLYNLNVTNSLIAGRILIENDKILSLSWELKLSAFSQISFFDQAVTIAKDGTITTKGALIAQGGIKTNVIQAVNDGEDINIKLKTQKSKVKSTTENAKLNIIDELGNVQASIDASGSAFFKALSLEKFTPATPAATIVSPQDNFEKRGVFASAIETASASAGIGILPQNQQEVIIYNDNVKADSLIYITPQNAVAQKLTVGEKAKGYFKVITDNTNHPNIKFDWLIIN